MRRLILFAIACFCSSVVLNAQIWEETGSDQLRTNRSETLSSLNTIHHFILYDFPIKIHDGDCINLPAPDGKLIPVLLKSSPVLDPALQREFPQIQAFSFETERISGRLAVDPAGIDVVYTTTEGRYAIEKLEGQRYEMYNLSLPAENSLSPVAELGKCLTPMGMGNAEIRENPAIHPRRAPRVNQKVYDLAISVTSTYAKQYGGTTESILTQINKIFNRVNEVFLREMALRFQIVEESTKLFFLDAESDPYTEGNNTLMLNKLDELLVATVFRKNYDLGHLLATDCGPGTAGVSAGVGTICGFNKGKALSCDLSNNLEDYVRVLTHELGHQLGAAHTWSNCPGVNNTQRSQSTAYEPGSGSSIMSYINTCGAENLTFIPGPFYFHTGSLQQMLEYTEIGQGSTCVTTEELNNESPEITSVNIPQAGDLYIPVSTPFILVAEATDSDGDDVTYAWDQLNTGPISRLGTPIQSGPSIRSYAPESSGIRYIPRLNSLIQNEDDPEEVLPTYNRDFRFGLTVRDNHPNGGGLAQEEVRFHSTTSAGPFFITFPNDSTDQLFAGSLAKVQWNVADTDEGLVNAKQVRIKMSADGGKTFPVILSEQTDNDGEQDIQIPNIVSDSVRLLIQGYDHVFFDISDQNIAVVNPDAPTFGLNISPGRQIICLPQTAKVSVSAFPILGFDGPISYSIENPYPNVQVELTNSQTMVNQNIDLTFQVPETLNSDTLFFKLKAVGPSTDTLFREISLIVVNNSHKELILEYPTDEIQGVEVVPSFTWNPSPNADYYTLEVSTSASFEPEFKVISEPNISADSFPSNTILEEGQVYFWRVIPHNKCSTTTEVPISAFQTKIQNCETFSPTDLPKGLGASSPGEILSKIEVAQDFEISDVNVLNIEGSHESVNQLKFVLQKDTTNVTLYEGECGIRSLEFDINYDDQSVDYTDCRLGSGTRVKPLEPLSAFNGRGSKGTWNFHWQDSTIGGGGFFENWMLELCGSVNLDRLQIKTDTLYVAPGRQNPLTSEQIQITNGSNIIFEWIDTTRSGLLLKNGVPLRPGQKWTAADLTSGMIQYKNTMNFNQEDIVLSAEDSNGQWSGVIKIPVSLDATVPVSISELSGKITIYPNPADTYITIRSQPDIDIKQIHIRNIHGQELYRYHSGSSIENNMIIRTNTWPAGMVFITITTGNDRWTDKIMIQ